MDKVYKHDIPAAIRELEDLRRRFAKIESKTDWKTLRVQPLLRHARALHKLMVSPAFSDEASRLRRGVSMFHADLVYLRENIKALKRIADQHVPLSPEKTGSLQVKRR